MHGKNGHEKDVLLQQTAEWVWLEHNGYIRKDGVDPKGIDEWISIFGKNYL